MIALAAETAATDTSLGALIMAGASLLMLSVGALILDVIRRRQRDTAEQVSATNAAVHTSDGTALAAALERAMRRIEVNEHRLTDQGGRLGTVEANTAHAHRRVDQLEDDVRSVRRDHGERIGVVEQEVAALKGAPCLGVGHE